MIHRGRDHKASSPEAPPSGHNFQFPEAAWQCWGRPELDAVWCPGFPCNNWILPGPQGGLDFSYRSNIIRLFCCCLFYKADVLLSLVILWALQYFQWLPFSLKLPKLFVSCIYVPWLIPWLLWMQKGISSWVGPQTRQACKGSGRERESRMLLVGLQTINTSAYDLFTVDEESSNWAFLHY